MIVIGGNSAGLLRMRKSFRLTAAISMLVKAFLKNHSIAGFGSGMASSFSIYDGVDVSLPAIGALRPAAAIIFHRAL